MAIDWEAFKSGERPVKTRSGLSARYGIRIIDPKFPHVVVVMHKDCVEVPRAYAEDGESFRGGSFSCCQDLALIQEEEVIEIVDYWNVYRDGIGGVHATKRDAAMSKRPGHIATVKVTTRIQGDKVTITGGTE